MRKLFFIGILISCVHSYAQKDTAKSYTITDENVKRDILTKLRKDSSVLLSTNAQLVCKCIDSIPLGLGNDELVAKVKACIDKEVVVYQAMKQINKNLGTSNNNIIVETNENSEAYVKTYRELERWLMDSCEALKAQMHAKDKRNPYSETSNPVAREAYNKGIELVNKEMYKEAIPYFKKAVENDDKFTFAWDNLGLCYRRTDDYDKALTAYEKSLSIYPDGDMPLHNIPYVYEFKKDYDKAITAYLNLLKHFDDDPETYYGIGRIYTFFKKDLEKGLDNMCKAYNLYTSKNSPYRVDAEKVISYICNEMKKNGQEDKFNEIIKANNISTK